MPRHYPPTQVKKAYAIALNRDPSPAELKDILNVLKKQTIYHNAKRAAQNEPAAGQAVEIDTLTDLCHVILNLNEFVYIN